MSSIPQSGSSERRKAQNRSSQKAYRERRKRRIQDLERVAGSTGLVTSSSSSSSSGLKTNSQAPPSTTSALVVERSSTAIQPPWIRPSQGLGIANVTSFEPFSRVEDLAPTIAFEIESPSPFRITQLSASSSHEDDRPTPEAQPKPTNIIRSGISITFSPAKPMHGWSTHSVPFIPNTHTPPISTRLPNPYTNTLRVHLRCFVEALSINCLHIGVSEAACCDDSSESPFYRPRITESRHVDLVVRAVQNTFAAMKPDLQPSRRQITTSHHPYIDILPFPSIRDRMIEMVQQGGGKHWFDEDDLWEDLKNDGLICWGALGTGKGDEGGGTGSPWDHRSWEAKPWFLEKWRVLVGGEDGELSKSSAWWRKVRGEDIVV